MDPISQKHPFGCGIACVAFVSNSSYDTVLSKIEKGKEKAENIGFFCKELVCFLQKSGCPFTWKYIKPHVRKAIYQDGSIVFLKRSDRYPSGHYLTRYKNMWMDPWINFPNTPIQAAFRSRLPGKVIYAIFPIR